MGKYKGGNGGIIVNMSSVAGLEGIPIAPIYGGTQYAIIGFTQSLKVKNGMKILSICIKNKFLKIRVYMNLVWEQFLGKN